MRGVREIKGLWRRVRELLREWGVWVGSGRFLSKADSYLIAYAMLGGHQIVTFEVPAPGSRNKIKIPDAGNAFGVSSITPFQMLRQHGVRM